MKFQFSGKDFFFPFSPGVCEEITEMIKIWWIIILGRLFIIDFFIGELNDLETVAFHRMIVDLEFCFNYILLFFFFFLNSTYSLDIDL